MTREQYGEAYEQGRAHTVRFLQSRGVSPDWALDLAQAAWVRAWERLDQLREESALLAWVNTIALNEFRKTLRHEWRHQLLFETPDPRAELNPAALDLSCILGKCRARDRALLKAQLQGVTAEDLSAQTGSTATAMRLRFFRARHAARAAALAVQTAVNLHSKPAAA